MNYKLLKKDILKGRVILQRSHTIQIILSIILFIFGGFMFIGGLALFLNPVTGSQTEYIFTGIGLVLITGGIVLNTQLKIPEYIIFDNNTSQFIIIEKKKDKKEYIAFPFSDIAAFHIRIHRSDNSVSHVVEMEKNDGAFWTLYSSIKQNTAKEFHNELLKYVNLNNPGSHSKSLRDNKNFKITEEGEKSFVSWKKRYSIFNHFLTLLMISSMGLVIYSIVPTSSDRIGYYLATGFIILISITYIFNIIYSVGRRSIVEITKDTFSFYTKGGIIKGYHFTMPIKEIESILFNFSTTQMENTIYILRKEDKDLLQKIKRGTIGLDEIVKAITLMLKIKKLEVGSLFIEDKIELENILQKLIIEKSSTSGL